MFGTILLVFRGHFWWVGDHFSGVWGHFGWFGKGKTCHVYLHSCLLSLSEDEAGKGKTCHAAKGRLVMLAVMLAWLVTAGKGKACHARGYACLARLGWQREGLSCSSGLEKGRLVMLAVMLAWLIGTGKGKRLAILVFMLAWFV